MAVRSKGTLLAGLAAVLGACLASGCTSSPAYRTTASRGGSSDVVVYRPEKTGQPVSTQNSALRTVPVPSGTTQPGIASTWQPVQRVSAEGVEPPIATTNPEPRPPP